MLESQNCTEQPKAHDVGAVVDMAAHELPPAAPTCHRAPQQPRLTAWDYVQIDRLMRARRRAARR